jgi:hypothetical protein
MEAEAGLSVMDLSTGAEAAVTVSTAGLLVTFPNVAVMLVLPAATPLARPIEIVASAGTEEIQVTLEVRFCVLLSLYRPVAVNCCVAPTVMEAEAGLTVMVLSTGAEGPVAEAAVTVSAAGLLVTPPNVAVMLVLPAITPLARPPEIVAMAGTEELQVTIEVKFRVLSLP